MPFSDVNKDCAMNLLVDEVLILYEVNDIKKKKT